MYVCMSFFIYLSICLLFLFFIPLSVHLFIYLYLLIFFISLFMETYVYTYICIHIYIYIMKPNEDVSGLFVLYGHQKLMSHGLSSWSNWHSIGLHITCGVQGSRTPFSGSAIAKFHAAQPQSHCNMFRDVDKSVYQVLMFTKSLVILGIYGIYGIHWDIYHSNGATLSCFFQEKSCCSDPVSRCPSCFYLEANAEKSGNDHGTIRGLQISGPGGTRRDPVASHLSDGQDHDLSSLFMSVSAVQK